MGTPPRIVSLVPSWTETLLAGGANVVGRTRFCIHPADQVAAIPKVGGTKDVDWEKVTALRPDLLVLDEEENTREIAEASPVPWIATRVRAVSDCGRELRRVAAAIEAADQASAVTEFGKSAEAIGATGEAPAVAAELRRIAERWERVALRSWEGPPCAEAGSPGARPDGRWPLHARHTGPARRTPPALEAWTELPGVLAWIEEPRFAPTEEWALVYLIWARPWMTVSIDTFIGSMLAAVGLGPAHERGLARLGPLTDRGTAAARYPEIDLGRLDPDRTLLLLSSEPYPFGRKRDALADMHFPAVLVDGESFSWFGVRSLRFLEGR